MDPQVVKILKERELLLEHKRLHETNIERFNDIINSYKTMHMRIPEELFSLKNLEKKLRRKDEVAFKQTNTRLMEIQKECQHDFRYKEETYGGNYGIYVCQKCGKIEWRK